MTSPANAPAYADRKAQVALRPVWAAGTASGSLGPRLRPADVRRARREQEVLKHLNPHHPLVVDTRELGRRPGSMRRATRTVPAPADFGNDVLVVPEGADIALDLRLESVMEGVLVTGTARAPVTGECVRCLDPVEQRLEADLQELYVYPDTEVPGADEADTLRLDGDLLDLEQVLRDAVVLALPLLPVCREDCPGLCPECGARLGDDPEHHHTDADPRWAALQALSDSTTLKER